MKIRVSLVTENALKYEADVLALKYAQNLYGLDRSAVMSLRDNNIPINPFPNPHKHLFIQAGENFGVKSIIFVGVVPLWEFGYREIREFSRRVLSPLQKKRLI